MLWVISVYFNVRDILPKSGTFPPGTPVYINNVAPEDGLQSPKHVEHPKMKTNYKNLCILLARFRIEVNNCGGDFSGCFVQVHVA